MKKDICIILSLLLYTFQLPIICKVEYPVTVKRKINVETSQLLTLIVFTYKFCSSYCQPSFLFIRQMISSTLNADNKP
jgi:hypothetical protein|nr:hypothetical protein [uncultured Bacteroides sp.]